MARLKRLIANAKRIRNVKWLDGAPCDVLIYDSDGSEVIRHCIPEGARTAILDVHRTLPAIRSARFFILLASSLLKGQRARIALLSSVVRTWNPKVVITFIDNDGAVAELKRIFPELMVVSVQNGIRNDFSDPDQPRIEYDHHYCFGVVDREILALGGHTAAHLYPVGSLKAGLFLESPAARQEKKFDLCFISAFMSQSELTFKSDSSHYRWVLDIGIATDEMQKPLFEIVARFAESNDMSLCVAMRHRRDHPDFDAECEYYSRNGKCQPVLMPRDGLSSYSAVRTSRLSVAINSTLAYEAMKFGERVLLAQDMTRIVSIFKSGLWQGSLTTQGLPDLLRLYSLDGQEFAAKASALMNMPSDEYAKYTSAACADYMNLDPRHPPHQIIKERISSFLAGNTAFGSGVDEKSRATG